MTEEPAHLWIKDPLAILAEDRVMIAGLWTVTDGQPAVDLARLRAEHGAAARRLSETGR